MGWLFIVNCYFSEICNRQRFGKAIFPNTGNQFIFVDLIEPVLYRIVVFSGLYILRYRTAINTAQIKTHAIQKFEELKCHLFLKFSFDINSKLD